MNLLHAREERRRCKADGRFGCADLHRPFFIHRSIALLHRRKQGARIVRFLFCVLCFLLRLVHDAPAGIALRAAARSKFLAMVHDGKLRLIKNMRRIELRDVAARDKKV